MDWSYELLSPAEQQVFAALGVFRGGCTVEAAEAVCAPGEADSVETVDVVACLASLVDASLLVGGGGTQARLRMLATVHEYARARLADCGDRTSLQARHADQYLALARRLRADLQGPEQSSALAGLDADVDNFRAALEWADTRPTSLGIELAVELWRFWYMRGHLSEGRRQLERVLARWTERDLLRADALRGAAVLAHRQGDLVAASRHTEDALDLLGRLDQPLALADALNTAGNISRDQGAHDAAALRYEESLAIYRRVGELTGISVVLNNLGTAARRQGDPARAIALHTESLALRRRAGDTFGVAYCLEELARAALDGGDADSALAYGLESLALRDRLGDPHGTASLLTLLADAARRRGAVDRAADYARRALALAVSVDTQPLVGAALARLAGVAGDRADWQRAALVLGALAGFLEGNGLLLGTADAAQVQRDTAAVRARSASPPTRRRGRSVARST